MADDNSDLKGMSNQELHKLVHDLRVRRRAAIAELKSRGEKVADDAHA